MNTYTLKSFKSFAEMSQETLCFHASLYRDNKKVGTVSNQGHGGPTQFDGSKEELHLLTCFCTTLPRDEDFDMDISVELFLDMLANDAEDLKWRKAQCRNKTLFRLVSDEDPDQWRTIAHKFDERVHNHLISKHGDNLGEIMNLTNRSQ